MAQMEDLLQAEKLMLDRLYADIEELLAQSSINNNVTVTKPLLEAVSSMFAGNPCRVDEYSSELTIHIVVSRNGGRPTSIKRLIEGIDVLIPAHLKYIIVFELAVDVDIHISKRSVRIPYDLCGWGFAGELPERNTLGAIRDKEVQIGITTQGAVFQSPLAGLYPNRNTAGAVSEVDVDVRIGKQTARIPHDLCGCGYAGELPERSVLGAVQDEEVQIDIASQGAVFQSPLAGLYPNRNTAGAVTEKDIEIQIIGQGAAFRSPLAGDPSGGGVSDGPVIPSVTTQAYFYKIDYCGTGYCGEEGD